MSEKQNLNFGAEIGKVLDIMINSLYTNKDVFLRELISNSSDACEKLRYKSISDQSLLEEDCEMKIIVEIDRNNNSLIIMDNGIGMSKNEMIENLGTIAKSGTGDFIKNLSNVKENSKINDMIGQFGVGFYSAFMVSDKVVVKSRKVSEESGNVWESNGRDGYSIEKIDEKLQRGTSVILYLKKDLLEEYSDKFKIRNIIENYSNHINIPIYLKHEEKIDEMKINKKAALWIRDKKDVTDDEYKEFFKSISHLPQEPWLIMHNKIEGNINYTNLLFIPSSKPFDLFHPDRQTKVKLYVKKIFITEQYINLIPKYLRFVYGIIDSPDLPLNISRETLQDSILMKKISELITKKIFSELKSKLEKDFDSYLKFWEMFGEVLKEGLCEPLSNREDLLDLCLFKTTKSGEKFITLKEYKDRMQNGQSDIYYYISETDDAEFNPQIEGFTKKNIEVLLLSEHVDNFWTTVVFDYNGIDVKSINRSDIDFSNIKSEEEDNIDKKNPNEEEITKLFMDNLHGLIKEVRISKKLIESPACLSISEGAMDIKMEKFLLSQGQIKKGMLKNLEINPKNSLIQKVLDLSKEGNKKKCEDLILSIYEIACIAQDEVLKNPNKFAKRIFDLLSN